MLLLLHQCSDSIRMDQHSLDQRMCCVLCDQALMPPSYLFLKCLFPPSDMSCSFFTSPVNFFFFIEIFPCCLLIARVTDSTAGTTKCGEVRCFPSAQKEWKRQAYFFWGKKNLQSEARVTAKADRLSMCVLFTGPKRFQRLDQMLNLLSFPTF